MTSLTKGLLGLTIASAGLFAFRSDKLAGSITGSVLPADGGTKVWAVSPGDTLQGAIQSGNFEISNVKPGTYRIIVEAKPPYKNTAKDNVTVADGSPTNVGAIKLSQ